MREQETIIFLTIKHEISFYDSDKQSIVSKGCVKQFFITTKC